MGAGTVAAGDEGILALRNGCKRIQNGSCLLNTGRVRRRSAQDEIVIQEGNALCFEAIYSAGEALFNKGFFLALGMDQNQVGIAELGGRDCLAGTGRLDFHSVAIGALEDGQQIAQQTRVFHRSGGGKADDLCLFGSGRNLTCINRGTVLDVEQILTVLLKAIVCGQVQRFLGQEPLDEGIRTGGIHRNVSDRVAVSIHKRRLGIYGDNGVGVEHLVVGFLQNAGIHHKTGLGGNLSGGFRRGSRCGGSGSLSGSLRLSRLACAAGKKTKHHGKKQQHGQNLFHCLTS